jgi:hypothetical protein
LKVLPFRVLAVAALFPIGAFIAIAVLAHDEIGRYLAIITVVLYVSAIVSIYFSKKKRRGPGSR